MKSNSDPKIDESGSLSDVLEKPKGYKLIAYPSVSLLKAGGLLKNIKRSDKEKHFCGLMDE